MIRLMDVSMITHPGLAHFAMHVCQAKEIPLQVAVRSGGGTNGGVYHSMQKEFLPSRFRFRVGMSIHHKVSQPCRIWSRLLRL